MTRLRFLPGLIAFILTCLALALVPRRSLAQAPVPDSYEENDALLQASLIPVGAELGSLTISPAADPDWFRVLVSPPAAYPGTYRVEVVATPGLDLTLNLYDPNATLVQTHNDPASPNASVTFSASSEGYYAVEVTSSTATEGWYLLRVVNLTPAPTPTLTRTPTPTATGTLVPTATSPFPTNTSTPDLGGAPDFAEPNYDFRTAYRLVPGDTLAGLNFNPGLSGAIDNDFFVMAVRYGITYTCQTHDLGPAVDTNLIVYGSASFDDLVGGSDDVDTQAGQIHSQLTFTATREGDVYLLVGYKYDDPNLRLPGNATYSLTCQAAAPTPTAAPQTGGIGAWPLAATPLSIELLSQPEHGPTPTSVPVIPQMVDVLVGYDRNANGEIEPNEGVADLSVRIIDVATNRELSHGFTDGSGTVRFILVTGAPIRVAIPFLGAAEDFRPGSAAHWTLLIPAANAPGLIP